MVSIAAFYAAQVAVSAYGIRRGGAPERIVAVLLLVAAVATSAVQLPLGSAAYGLVEAPLLLIDVALFVSLCAVSALADRYWPMWLTALHLIGIAAHGAKQYRPDIAPPAYWFLTSWISVPMLVILAAGTIRHQRRKAAGLPEADWSWLRRNPD